MMRLPTHLLLAVLSGLLLLAGCSSGRAHPEPGAAPVGAATTAATGGTVVAVTKVTDGDTFYAVYLGRDERIRLIGVDTPEVPWYGGKGECYGVEAGLYTRERLVGRSVRLEFDQDLRDRYGRLLAYAYLGNDLFNLTLVRLGYARADAVPPDTRMAAAFGRAQSEAEAAGIGLWSACPAEGP